MYQLNNRRRIGDLNIFVMNDKLTSCKSSTAIRRQTHNVTPVCGWWIPPCFTVHHHFLLIRIQRKNNIIWLLAKNRPKLFTFCQREKKIKTMMSAIITTGEPISFTIQLLSLLFPSLLCATAHFVPTSFIANKRKGRCTPPQHNGIINNKKHTVQ